MAPFEEELKKALERRQPPEDFTARVLAKTEADGRRDFTGWFRPARTPLRLFAPLAAMLLLITGGTIYQHNVHVEQGQAAKRQLLVAMRIAGAELREAESRVKRIHSSEVVLQ